MEHLKQFSHKIFDLGSYINWFQGIFYPEMAVIDRQNQYPRADLLQMRQPFRRIYGSIHSIGNLQLSLRKTDDQKQKKPL